MHACSPGTWEVEAVESEAQSHPWLHSEFEARLGSIRPLSKKEKKDRKVSQCPEPQKAILDK